MKTRLARVWILEEDAQLLKALSLKKRKPMYKVVNEKLRVEGELDFRFSF